MAKLVNYTPEKGQNALRILYELKAHQEAERIKKETGVDVKFNVTLTFH